MALNDAGTDGQVYALAAAIPVTLVGTVAKGDPIGQLNTNPAGWQRANATVGAGTLVHAALVALEAGVAGKVIKASPVAYIEGRFGGACVPGAKVYSHLTAGRYSETKPNATSGDATTEIGVSVTLTGILVHIAGNRSVKP